MSFLNTFVHSAARMELIHAAVSSAVDYKILKSVEHPRGSKLDFTQKFKYMLTRLEDITVHTMFGICKPAPSPD